MLVTADSIKKNRPILVQCASCGKGYIKKIRMTHHELQPPIIIISVSVPLLLSSIICQCHFHNGAAGIYGGCCVRVSSSSGLLGWRRIFKVEWVSQDGAQYNLHGVAEWQQRQQGCNPPHLSQPLTLYRLTLITLTGALYTQYFKDMSADILYFSSCQRTTKKTTHTNR